MVVCFPILFWSFRWNETSFEFSRLHIGKLIDAHRICDFAFLKFRIVFDESFHIFLEYFKTFSVFGFIVALFVLHLTRIKRFQLNVYN